MSTDPDEWTDLRKIWNAPQLEAGSLNQLRARVRRERVRMMLESAAEALISVGCAAAFLWWARDSQGVERVVLLMLAAGAIASILVTTALRRRLWRAQGESITACRDLLHRHARLGLLFARIGYVGGLAGVLCGLALAQFGIVDGGGRTPINSFIALAASITFAGGWIWAVREAGRRRRMIEDIASDDRRTSSEVD